MAGPPRRSRLFPLCGGAFDDGVQAGHGQGRAPAPAPEDDLGNGAEREEFLGLGHVDKAYGMPMTSAGRTPSSSA